MGEFINLKFLYLANENTIFVDPNGSDTYDGGRQLNDKANHASQPFATISAAITYLENNSLQDYTIWVFPGVYGKERQWFFNTRNNRTTIKLQGGVTIEPDWSESWDPELGGLGAFITALDCSISIIGDDAGSYYSDAPCASISIPDLSKQHGIIKCSMISATSDIEKCNINLTNIGLTSGYWWEAPLIVYTDAQAGSLNLTNCNVSSPYQNIQINNTRLSEAVEEMPFFPGIKNPIVAAVPIDPTTVKLSIKNSYLEVAVPDSRARRFTNIEYTRNSSNLTSYMFLTNSRFVIDTAADTVNGHIETTTIGQRGVPYHIIWSDCVFWAPRSESTAIWTNYGGSQVAYDTLGGIVSTNRGTLDGNEVLTDFRPTTDISVYAGYGEIADPRLYN